MWRDTPLASPAGLGRVDGPGGQRGAGVYCLEGSAEKNHRERLVLFLYLPRLCPD